MNNTKWIVIGIVSLAIFVGLFIEDNSIAENNARNERVEVCTKAMQEAIPDPNDSQARAEFLKNCY